MLTSVEVAGNTSAFPLFKDYIENTVNVLRWLLDAPGSACVSLIRLLLVCIKCQLGRI